MLASCMHQRGVVYVRNQALISCYKYWRGLQEGVTVVMVTTDGRTDAAESIRRHANSCGVARARAVMTGRLIPRHSVMFDHACDVRCTPAFACAERRMVRCNSEKDRRRNA